MAETIQERINTYLQDTISAERNFEDALSSFGKAGEQLRVQQLLASFSAKAKTQHQRLTALLEKRGGSPSSAKTALAEMLAFSPLTAQIGQGAEEKNTQHLMVTFAAAAAEKAMYESLATAGAQAGDSEVESLARTLQSEEQQDADQVWNILPESARSSFRTELSKDRNAREVIATYLEDAIAAEKSFESQLLGFAKSENDATTRTLFEQHARETHAQYEQLTSRLHALGGSTSAVKTFLAHIFNFAPKLAQAGHDAVERLTQNLMMAYAVENAEVAMYQCLVEACRAAGDTETERLALSVQQQEKATAEKVWTQLGRAAGMSVGSAARGASAG